MARTNIGIAAAIGMASGMAMSIAAASPARAQAPAERSFDIPAQSLGSALVEFSRQSDKAVLASAKLTRGKSAREVRGRFNPRAALQIMLRDTGLQIRTNADGSFVLERAGQGRTAGTDAEEVPMAVAVEDRGVSDILVVGRKTLNVDVARSEDDAKPYVIFDKRAIDQSGARNIEEFLRKRLTASTDYESNTLTQAFVGNKSSISLRGLGPDETLILIDGRRTAGTASGNSFGQPNLNGIPLAAVERIEVLPSSAAGIYGGGATGGVINVILRRDYSGAEIRFSYESPFRASREQLAIQATIGLPIGSKTNLLLTGSYVANDRLTFGDTDYVQRYRRHLLAVDPALIYADYGPPVGRTTNIQSIDGSNLSLIGGAAIGSPRTFVPIGYRGISSDGGAALIGNGGKFNLDLADTAQTDGARATIYNPPSVISGGATLRHQFSPRIDAYASLFYSRTTGRLDSTVPFYYALPAGAPGNPFEQDVIVTPPVFVGGPFTSETTELRAAGGLVVRLPAEWAANIDYAWSRAISGYISRNIFSFDDTAFGDAISAGTIDIFRDNSQNPPDLSGFFLDPARQFPRKSMLANISLRLGGPLPVSLPGGRPSLTTLIERRSERLGSTYEVAPAFFSETFMPPGSRRAYGAYGELKLPILSPSNRFWGAYSLEIEAAGRWEDYSIDGAGGVPSVNGVPSRPISTINNRFRQFSPSVALRYQPIADLTLRASYGKGFLPPSLIQIFPGLEQNSTFRTLDPLRNNEPIGRILLTAAGNPDLQPEKSVSISAGAILEPRFVPGLRLSVDWTRIRKRDAISTLNFQIDQRDMNLLIALFPERIVRAAPGPGESVGRIVSIARGALNLNRAEVQAWDFGASYTLETRRSGTFWFSSKVTLLTRNQTQLRPADPFREEAGVQGNLRWRANATFGWDHKRWSTSWSTQFFDSYFLEETRQPYFLQGAAKIGGQIQHDLFVSYRLYDDNTETKSWNSGLELSGGVRNIFDAQPKIDARQFTHISPFGETRGAVYYLSLRKAFGL